MDRRRFIQTLATTAVAVQSRSMWAATRDRVLVVGGGIMGASIAYHLVKQGAEVTLLEKDHPAAGTTKNSFAWLNASGKSPRSYYELNLAGMEGWRRLALEIGPELPVQWGGSIQWSIPDPSKLPTQKKHIAERQSWGYSIREVGESDIPKLVPGILPGPVGFAQYADQEATIDPVVAAHVLVARAKSLGAKVLYPCEITGLDLGDGRIRGVQTTQGKMEADYVVLAAGNATPALAALAGLSVPLKESKGILAHSTPQPQALNKIVMPPTCDAKQHPDGRIVTGLNFDDTGDVEPTMEVGVSYFEKLAKFLPAAAKSKVDFMTLGYRVLPKDGLPIIDRSPKYPNLYVAAQHGGMTCSPAVGQLLSMEILDQVSVDMLQPYRLSRFSS
jgi:glycine/D-amino acid oxidase-like deaminating enzyme